VDLSKHLEVALDLAAKDIWDGPIPDVGGYSLKLGILIHRLRSRVPDFWHEKPDELAKQLIDTAPALAAEIVKYDPVAFGFVVRTQRFLAKRR
jgi:hypothetical protein